MTRGEWITLVGAVAAALGLIPAYRIYFSRTKRIVAKDQRMSEVDKSVHYFMGTVLAIMGSIVLITEMAVFDVAAKSNHVAVDLGTMPLDWRLTFYSLFIAPGVLFIAALVHVLGAMRR
jgi:hypothetical protein